MQQTKKKIVVLTGAGVSAESGIPTFRDAGGLWEGYDIHEVATPEAWRRNPALVLDFYNQRRKNVRQVQPNPAHHALKQLEDKYDVTIITQNIDNLHERAGSSNIIHLHGEILKARSTRDENLVYDLGDKDIQIGDTCEKGSQLRPHIVWFGEAVPLIETAAWITAHADILMVVGTSMVVYPAAGLVRYVKNSVPIYVIDPVVPEGMEDENMKFIVKKAGEGVPELVSQLMA